MDNCRVRVACLLAGLVVAAAAADGAALRPDGWRVGIQALGTGLVSVVVEYHFSDNAICLNAGIFDSFTEPDVALWYRRYLRISPLDSWGLALFGGVGLGAVIPLQLPIEVIGMGAVAAGVDWTIWSTLSLCVEADLLIGFWPLPMHAAVTPALSLRYGF